MKAFKRKARPIIKFLPIIIGTCCSATAVAQQPVSEQFSKPNPPEVPDVEITGHILKPKPLEPNEERLERLDLPVGFEISIFAEDLENPRMLAVADNGDVYVTQRATGDVTRLVDEDSDGQVDHQQIVASRPDMHGIAIDGETVYLVTDTELYQTNIEDDGDLAPLELLVGDLPDAGQHPNRTIVVGPDDMLYLSVGSTCNACDEPNPENATILQLPPDGSSRTIFASGLRNTIGFGFHPETGELYGMDHGTDWLGDNEQHEELNHIVEGGHYGWPFLFDDNQYNPADEPPGELSWSDWEERSIEPVGYYVPHAAPMQMVYYTGNQFPEEYQGDAFVAMRGSWNRKPPSGYEVLRVRFDGGKPAGFEPLVKGFLMQEDGDWGHMGRLAGMAQAGDGALLLSDDENGVVYRITYADQEAEEEPDKGAVGQPTNPEGSQVRIDNQASKPVDQPEAHQLAIDRVGGEENAALNPQSPAFNDGEAIPDIFAAEQQNISPPLQWEAGPEGTESYAIIVQDPDAPMETPFVHWVLYNIPADTTELEKGIPGRPILARPENALQGENDRGSFGYYGPRPPVEDGAHHYHFQVFALDQELDLEFGATAGEVIQAMEGHTLGSGRIVGTYER